MNQKILSHCFFCLKKANLLIIFLKNLNIFRATNYIENKKYKKLLNFWNNGFLKKENL